jgi:Ca2+-dependent lipid-binding protein
MATRTHTAEDQQKAITKLKIDLDRGENLIAADNSGVLGTGKPETSDPYVILKQGHIEKKSNHIPKNLNPTWNEHFEILVIDGGEKLKLHVKDSDIAGDDDLGEAEIDLKDVPVFPAAPKEYVAALKGKTENSGKIHLKLQLEGAPLQFPTAKTNQYQLSDQLAAKRVLKVHLQSGENLTAGGTPNPYVVVKQGLFTKQGSVSLGSNPNMEEHIDVPVFDAEEFLSLSAYDKNLIGFSADPFLGATLVKLSDVGDQEKQFVLPLFSAGLSAPNKAFITLSLKFETIA